ncbi:MAG: hypothetical protein WD185_08210 [Sneathiella sp.]
MKYIKALPLILLAIMVVVNAESDKFASHAADANGMAITEAWARERPAYAMMGGAFLTIKKYDGLSDRLFAA